MATKKTPAVDEAATEHPPEREPMAGVSAAPASADLDNADTVENTGGDEQAQSDVELVAMRRDAPLFPDGPVTADVHPNEVANYRFFGWEINAEPGA